MQSVDEKDVRPSLKELYESLRDVSGTCLSHDHNGNLRNLLNAAFTVEASDSAKAVCWRRENVGKVALANIPFGHIVTLGDFAFIVITGKIYHTTSQFF